MRAKLRRHNDLRLAALIERISSLARGYADRSIRLRHDLGGTSEKLLEEVLNGPDHRELVPRVSPRGQTQCCRLKR